MKTKSKENVYEPPQVKVIEVEVENGFAMSGSTLENPRIGETSSW